MKSKPTNKKLKVEVTNLGPPTTPEKGVAGTTPSVSPAGSTSSNASSLLSIGPPTYSIGIRPIPEAATGSVTGSTGSVKSGNAKSKGGAKDKEAAKGGVVVEGSALGGSPTFPLITHFNLAEFPKINACILGSKGGTGVAAQVQANATPGVTDANKPLDALTMEDIDPLQAELETLWSNVATRIRILHREQSNLQTVTSSGSSSTSTTHHHHNLGLEHFDPQHQEKIASVAAIIDHGTRTSVSAAAKLVMGVQLGTGNSPVPSPSPATQSVTSTPSTKRSGNTKGERLPKKKLKGEGPGGSIGKAKKAGGGGGVEKPAARATVNRSHSVCSDFGAPTTDGGVKHEVPTQFWESVETYCRELAGPDLEGLNGVLEEHGELPHELFEIPPLGKHFRDDEETAKTKARESRVNSSRDFVGPLTQRLVSALVDERVSMFNNNHLNSPKEDASLATSANNNPEGGYLIHRHGLVRALGLDSGGSGSSSPSLESRIRDCLVDHGLLPPDDAHDPILLNPDDELLAEIKRTQSVLKKLHNYNADKILGVIDIGKRAMDRNVHKRDLDKADKDVFETFKNLSAIRLKKKPVTKKEKDAAIKMLEARKRVLLKLESIRSHRDNAMRFGGTGPVDSNGLLRVV